MDQYGALGPVSTLAGSTWTSKGLHLVVQINGVFNGSATLPLRHEEWD